MKKLFIFGKILLLLFILGISVGSNNSYGQWHSAKDTLKYSSIKGNGQIAVYWFNNLRYDTVKCLGKTNMNNIVKCYKVVFYENGHFIDDSMSYNLFLTLNKKDRLLDISCYMFSEWDN